MAMQSKVLNSAHLRDTGRKIQEICVEVKKNFDNIFRNIKEK